MRKNKLRYGHISLNKSEFPDKDKVKDEVAARGYRFIRVKTGAKHNLWEATVAGPIYTNNSYRYLLRNISKAFGEG